MQRDPAPADAGGLPDDPAAALKAVRTILVNLEDPLLDAERFALAADMIVLAACEPRGCGLTTEQCDALASVTRIASNSLRAVREAFAAIDAATSGARA